MNDYQDNSTRQYNEDNRGNFPIATRICGIVSMSLGLLSVVACCLGYLSIPIGALGILFAVLSRRKGKPLPRICKTGLVLSIIGMVIGFAMLLLTIYSTITNPNFWEYFRDTYEQYEEMYKEICGADFETYQDLTL